MSEKNPKKEFKHIVRIAQTDLDGSKPIYHSLNKIKGVSFMFANAICAYSDIDRFKITGNLTQQDVEKLNDILSNPLKYGFPIWMLNRRNDVETGDDKHVIGADLKWQLENDLKRLKKIKTYKGVRHMHKLPVRGQRTKSNFRNKRGKSIGVKRKGK